MYSFRVSTLRGLYHRESLNFYRYFHCYCKCFFHFLHLLIIPITHFNQLLLICWQFFQNAKHFMISLPEKRNKLLLYYRRFFFLFFVTVIWKVRYFSIVKIIKFEIQTAFITACHRTAYFRFTDPCGERQEQDVLPLRKETPIPVKWE